MFFLPFCRPSAMAKSRRSRGGKKHQRGLKAAAHTVETPFLVFVPSAPRGVVRKRRRKASNAPKRGRDVPAEISTLLCCSGRLELGGGSTLSWTHAPQLDSLWHRPGFADEAMASLRNVRGEQHTGSTRKARRDTLCFAFEHPEHAELELMAIVNGYGKGDNIQHHRDDEPQIVVDCPIATYSFGTSACFEIKTRRGVLVVASIPTRTGLVVSMNGQRFQMDFTHGLPGKIQEGYRLSITLRTCKAAASSTYDFSDMRLTPQSAPLPPAGGVDDDAGALCQLVASCVRHALGADGDEAA